MSIVDQEALAKEIVQLAYPLRGERAEITQRLIEEKGFSAIAVEADWPDAYRVNRYVRGLSADRNAVDSLDDFQRFPVWMWRNHEIVRLVDWLRTYNRARSEAEQIGFYGLDLYSLYNSISSVVAYLETVDSEAAQRARERYACFDHATGEAQQYGYNVLFRSHPNCEQEAIQQLQELRARRSELLQATGLVAIDEQFAAEQNAVVVQNAEAYYRAMFGRTENTWNLRDQHMSDTLDALRRHLGRSGRSAKIVVWAHNSHIGDASATDRSQRGEHNLGQLSRQRYGEDCRLIGFTTYSGTVTAASNWDSPAEHKRVRPALRGSCEDLLHAVAIPEFFLDLQHESIVERLRQSMLQRFIGVIYLPQTERQSHYYYARLADQYDALFHFDHSRALEPLDRTAEWKLGAMPETYPSGL